MKQRTHESAPPASIDDIRGRYEDEWLLIKILDTTVELGQAPGELLAHGPHRGGMFKASRKALQADPSAALTVVHGGKALHDGDAFRRELARIGAEEAWLSVNSW